MLGSENGTKQFGNLPVALIFKPFGAATRQIAGRGLAGCAEIVSVDIGQRIGKPVFERTVMKGCIKSGIASQLLCGGKFGRIGKAVKGWRKAVDIDATIGIIAAQIHVDRIGQMDFCFAVGGILAISVALIAVFKGGNAVVMEIAATKAGLYRTECGSGVANHIGAIMIAIFGANEATIVAVIGGGLHIDDTAQCLTAIGNGIGAAQNFDVLDIADQQIAEIKRAAR